MVHQQQVFLIYPRRKILFFNNLPVYLYQVKLLFLHRQLVYLPVFHLILPIRYRLNRFYSIQLLFLKILLHHHQQLVI